MKVLVEIEVVGLRASTPVEAVIDTGFDGELSLPLDIAVPLGLELAGTEWVEYADGRVERELWFWGAVSFLGETKQVRISLTDSEDALIGMALLTGCTLFIDCDTGEVRIERKLGNAGER